MSVDVGSNFEYGKVDPIEVTSDTDTNIEWVEKILSKVEEISKQLNINMDSLTDIDGSKWMIWWPDKWKIDTTENMADSFIKWKTEEIRDILGRLEDITYFINQDWDTVPRKKITADEAIEMLKKINTGWSALEQEFMSFMSWRADLSEEWLQASADQAKEKSEAQAKIAELKQEYLEKYPQFKKHVLAYLEATSNPGEQGLKKVIQLAKKNEPGLFDAILEAAYKY